MEGSGEHNAAQTHGHQAALVRIRKEEQVAERQKQEKEAARSAAAHKRAAELEAAYEVEIWKQQEQVHPLVEACCRAPQPLVLQ